ncbi:MAG: FkbM family methyltransferase [Planctomycetota bacterium]
MTPATTQPRDSAAPAGKISLPAGGHLLMATPSEMTRRRLETLLTKEPGTIAWIDAFSDDDAFWDVGANVGVYSLYAASRGVGAVLAIEPLLENATLLSSNILLNGFESRIAVLNAGLSNTSGRRHLLVRDPTAGASGSTLGEPVTFRGKRFEPRKRQAVLTTTLDALAHEHGAPAHLKIDVDGLEPEILDGGRKLLGDPALRSVLIELDTRPEGRDRGIEPLLRDHGFDGRGGSRRP